MLTQSGYVCPVCSCTSLQPFFEILDVPAHVCVQWPTRQEALHCPKGDIRLGFCSECGFISNLLFDPTRLEYSSTYENSLHFSPFFQKHVQTLASRLVERYDLRGKQIIEIGCGKGEFLLLMCQLGDNTGIGFDPSYSGNGAKSQGYENVTFVRDFYSEKHASFKGDLVCCRYVFEHIEKPRDFLTMVRNAIGGRQSAVYFEVPNVSLILKDLSVWDLIYEHCSYFGLNSIGRVFSNCGFEVKDLYRSYGEQFIGIEAMPVDEATDWDIEYSEGVMEIAGHADRFAQNYRNKLDDWQERLVELAEAGKRAVLWGAGAKGVSFANMLRISDQIRYIVDINPRKRGKFIAGAGQEIIGPQFLVGIKPDVVIISNPIYKDEIQETVSGLGLNPEYMFA